MDKPKRLKAPDRRRLILQSAQRVFAEKGFVGATSRELAAAAGVSESLLYKHFPSKEVLYKELVSLFEDRKDEILTKLTGHPPSGRAFVTSFYFLGRIILLGHPAQEKDDSVDRLICQSLLSDGEFALAFLDNFFHPVLPYLTECLQVAWKAGELDTPSSPSEAESVVFHHLMGMLATFNLPEIPLLPFVDEETMLRNALLFGYRGVGFTEVAIAQYAQFDGLRDLFMSSLLET